MYEEEAIMNEYITLGANGFLAKNCSIDETVDVIFNVFYEGKQNLNQSSLDSKSIDKILLDDRELIVLNLICEGKTSEEISQQIYRSKKTVDLIRTRLMQKFEVSNVIELVKKTIFLGFYIR
jgi:DNA-binding NarL/FixJ family response regulator